MVLELEHSLVSISKWESIWEKPFIDERDKTSEEILSYVQLMILTPNAPENAGRLLPQDQLEKINTYINAKMTATWFAESKKSTSRREVITSEVIYHWLVALQIPFEVEEWHLNRLLTLVRVCNEKSSSPKKMSRAEIGARNRELNAARKAKMGTSG